MKAEFISLNSFRKRCESGEFYPVDCENFTGEYDLRQARIEDLVAKMNHFGTNLYVSDYVNRVRLLFVEVDLEFLSTNMIKDFREWVAKDTHQHAIMGRVFKSKKSLGKFLVTREHLICDKSLKNLTILDNIS